MMPLDGLESLLVALVTDDKRLIQGTTSCPPPLMCVQDWPCEGSCALGWTFYKGGDVTVGEVEEHFAAMCFQADQMIGEIAGSRWFLNWFDDTPRDQMRRELIPEVIRAVFARRSNPSADWWDTPNDGFGGETPWAVAQRGDAEAFNRAGYYLESGVAS